MSEALFTGIDLAELGRLFERGTDHGNNRIEPYTDEAGGWPLRCCLSYSEVGEEIALLAWTPFNWTGVYAETGPIFVHANPCDGPSTDRSLPDELDRRAMVLRPYTPGHRIAYQHVRYVPEGGSLMDNVRELLAEPTIEFVHGRNVTGGCYSFEARLGDSGGRRIHEDGKNDSGVFRMV